MINKFRKSVKTTILICAFALVIGAVIFLTLYPKGNGKASQPESVTPPIEKTEKPDANTLRLLVWEGYAPEKYVKDFEKHIEKKYGKTIKLDISLVKNDDEFYKAIRDKNVDLVTFGHFMFKDERFQLIQNKLILPFNLENIPNYSNIIPDLKETDFHKENGKTYGIPFSHGLYGLVYNTNKFKMEPKSWKVFWDPANKNTYTIAAHEYLYNVHVTALMLGYPRESISNFDTLNNDNFRKNFKTACCQCTLLLGWNGYSR